MLCCSAQQICAVTNFQSPILCCAVQFGPHQCVCSARTAAKEGLSVAQSHSCTQNPFMIPIMITLLSCAHLLSVRHTNLCGVQPGVHRRAWCAVNEHCNGKGPVWSTKHCILMEPMKQVPSRGTNLQQAFNSPTTAAPTKGPAVQVDLGPVDWLQYGGKLLAQLPLHFWMLSHL